MSELTPIRLSRLAATVQVRDDDEDYDLDDIPQLPDRSDGATA